MAQIGQCPSNARVTSGAILAGQLDNQILNFVSPPWPSGLAGAARIVFLGHQAPVPSQQGIGRHQAGEPIQRLSAQSFAFEGQAPTLAIIEPGLLAQQFLEHTDFFL
jgi:hypothetical protein